MHCCGLIHRDVKPSSVLLDKKGWPKICDFELAMEAMWTENEPWQGCVGTYGYMAPEADRGYYACVSDWYSFGVILYQVFGGDLRQLRRRYKPEEILFTENTPIRVQEFIRNLLQDDPDHRHDFLYMKDFNFLDPESGFPLSECLYRLVLEDMNLTEEERQVVETYVQTIEHEEEELLG